MAINRTPDLTGTHADIGADCATIEAALAQARKDHLKRLFAMAMVTENPHRREAILARLAELTKGRP